MNPSLCFNFLRRRGQSALEFALVFPLVFGLLLLIFYAFSINDRAAQRSVIDYGERLDQFNHGNGSLDIGGMQLPARQFAELLPLTPFPNAPSGGPLISPELVKGLLTKVGLNALFSNINFLNGETYLSGAARSALTEIGGNLVQDGRVNWENVAWASATGALSSEQATLDFQGKNFAEGSGRELLGSTLQGSALGFTSSKGNLEGAARGGLSGLTGSDTVRGLAESGAGIDVLVGAAKGALTSTVEGALSGEKINAKSVLTATGMGAFQTRSVASALPFSAWQGNPLQSASFGAANAAVAAKISGGNTASILEAAAGGAMYSGQIAGQVGERSQLLAGMVGGAYAFTSSTVLKKESAEAAGKAALQGFISGQSAKIKSDLQLGLTQAAQFGGVGNLRTFLGSAEAINAAQKDSLTHLQSAELANQLLLISALLLEGSIERP